MRQRDGLLRPRRDYNIDEVFLTINGQRHYLWRAVDQDDNVLDILVQCRRNKQAAKKFFRKLLKGCQYVPRVIKIDGDKAQCLLHRLVLLVVLCWSVSLTALWPITAKPHRGGSISLMPTRVP